MTGEKTRKINLTIEKVGPADYRVWIKYNDGTFSGKSVVFIREWDDVVYLMNRVLYLVNRKYKMMIFKNNVRLVNMETSVSADPLEVADLVPADNIDKFVENLRELAEFCVKIASDDLLQKAEDSREIEIEIE